MYLPQDIAALMTSACTEVLESRMTLVEGVNHIAMRCTPTELAWYILEKSIADKRAEVTETQGQAPSIAKEVMVTNTSTIPAVENWLSSSSRNSWLQELGYSFYLRKGYHHLGIESAKHTLDIANIEVGDTSSPPHRLWELFDLIATAAAQLRNIQYLYVENLLNDRLAESLRRRGWVELYRYGGCKEPPSFYRKILSA